MSFGTLGLVLIGGIPVYQRDGSQEKNNLMQVDHIAFVTRQIRAITDTLPDFCDLLPVEHHPAEGTREQYVKIGDTNSPMLLLMQSVSDGPYLRALNKRGAGLHHIGGVTSSIQALLPDIQKSRLLLHPVSLQTYEQKIVWLCRSGVPFLIELIERSAPAEESNMCHLHLPAGTSIPDFIPHFFKICLFRIQKTIDFTSQQATERFHSR